MADKKKPTVKEVIEKLTESKPEEPKYKNTAEIEAASTMDELVKAVEDLKPDEKDMKLINEKAFQISQVKG